MTFPWIDLSYSYEAINQTLLSGQGAQFLENQTSNTVNIGVHHDWETFAARANAMLRNGESRAIYRLTMTDLSQNISYHARWSILLSASGDETFTDYTAPKHRSRSYCPPSRAEIVPLGRWNLLDVCIAAQSAG